jgi:hypothetical protein
MNEVSCITDGSNFNRQNPELIRLNATKVIKDIKVTQTYRIDRTLKITQKKTQQWADNEIYLLDIETGLKLPKCSKEETLEIQDWVSYIFVT